MKGVEKEKKIAVLVDAENTQWSALGSVLAELSKHGYTLVKRAYGDWSSDLLKGWKQPLNDLAITPIQQFSYTKGKNSSDMAMVIDAMDLLYSEKYDAFALVSSDSDFTKLASRLREFPVYVFGVGEEKTPPAFRNACDDFIPIEVLSRDLDSEKESDKNADEPRAAKAKELHGDSSLKKILIDAVNECADDNDDGWAPLSKCGSLIKRQNPDFDTRAYGYRKLGELVKDIGLFEIDARNSHIYLKLR